MSIAEEVRKLEELHSSGSLSDEEFEQANRRVLEGHASSGSASDGMIHGISEQTWCTLLHLSQLLMFLGGIGVVVPIVMWVISKDVSESARLHGANMINWLISSFIYLAVSGMLSMVLIGIPFLIAVALLDVVFPVIAGIKANNGELWKYPLAIQFIRAE